MSRYHYETKEDLPLPWIKCLWCNYKDKIERDLGWHFLQKHRYQLSKLGDDYYFLYRIEDLIDKAIKLAWNRSIWNKSISFSTGVAESH